MHFGFIDDRTTRSGFGVPRRDTCLASGVTRDPNNLQLLVGCLHFRSDFDSPDHFFPLRSHSDPISPVRLAITMGLLPGPFHFRSSISGILRI